MSIPIIKFSLTDIYWAPSMNKESTYSWQGAEYLQISWSRNLHAYEKLKEASIMERSVNEKGKFSD